MNNEPQFSSAATLSLVSQLLEAGNLDTLYRDIYVARAQTLMEPLLPERKYHGFKKMNTEIDDLLRQLAPIVERQEWAKVIELTSRLRSLQETAEANNALFKVGANLYELTNVPLDPFCQGLQSVGHFSINETSKLRDELAASLIALEQKDALWRDFYARRRTYFQGLPLASAEQDHAMTADTDAAQIQRQARWAVDKRDLRLLERLAKEMLRPKSRTQLDAVLRSMADVKELSFAFAENTLSGARKLKLIPVEVDSSIEFGEYLQCCCAWQAILPDQPLTAGEKRSRGCTCGHVCPPSMPERLKETLDLLILHPFVNSAGQRYLPRFVGEQGLVEDFPEEQSASVSDLVRALGLSRRTALSKMEIDRALLRRGADIVRNDLDLDPQHFRLVCIPFDLYSRLAPVQGWGKQTLWTHFDGYQLWKGNRLRALVGGDVRFGGRYDLCSISVADERDNVTARFAVVRRERLVPGY